MTERLTSIVSPHQINAMIELVMTLPKGDFAEVGVYKGGTAQRLYEVCMQQGRELHLFDTFSGTPYHTEGLDHHKIDREFAAEEAIAQIRYLMPAARLYVGRYPDTHPDSMRQQLAFVHCDCDQYLSYKAVIEVMYPLLVPGGIMLFDDYPYLAGAKKAVEEDFKLEDLKVCHSRNYVVKPYELDLTSV